MLYKTAPIIKYMLLLGIFYLFFKNYKTITNESYIHVVVFFIFCIIALDLIIIKNHPQLFDDKDIKEEKYNEESEESEEDVELSKKKSHSKKQVKKIVKKHYKKIEDETDTDDLDTDED